MILPRTPVIIFAIVVLAGCQDNSDAVITASLDGQWKGTLAEIEVRPFGLPIPFKEDDASFATRIGFASDGTFTVWEGNQPIAGKFTLVGDQLNIETDYTLEDIGMAGTYVIETLTDQSLVIYTERDDQIVDPDGAPAVNGDIKVTLHFARD